LTGPADGGGVGGVLSAGGLSRWYGPVIALNNVSFDLGPGITALVGPNGAGKSTLLRILTGEVRPSRGGALVLGEAPWGNQELFRRVGYCPEQDSLYEEMDAPGFVSYLMRLRGFDGRTARSRAETALAAAGLDPAAWGRKVGGYSKGMRQRVRIAQSIAHSPEVLFLDEPLTGLDPVGRRELRDLFRSMAAGGTTILMSSHVLHEVESTTDRILLLHRSKLLAEGTVSDIRALIDRHPHSVEVACDRPRDLAARLVALPEVESVGIPSPGLLVALTRTPQDLYPKLVRILVEDGIRVKRLSSPDDNLEAVFRYLVHG
jgi:ABC-2 type transport system ATP-binding protein